jgi:hypothetical protein
MWRVLGIETTSYCSLSLLLSCIFVLKKTLKSLYHGHHLDFSKVSTIELYDDVHHREVHFQQKMIVRTSKKCPLYGSVHCREVSTMRRFNSSKNRSVGPRSVYYTGVSTMRGFTVYDYTKTKSSEYNISHRSIKIFSFASEINIYIPFVNYLTLC